MDVLCSPIAPLITTIYIIFC